MNCLGADINGLLIFEMFALTSFCLCDCADKKRSYLPSVLHTFGDLVNADSSYSVLSRLSFKREFLMVNKKFDKRKMRSKY